MVPQYFVKNTETKYFPETKYFLKISYDLPSYETKIILKVDTNKLAKAVDHATIEREVNELGKLLT